MQRLNKMVFFFISVGSVRLESDLDAGRVNPVAGIGRVVEIGCQGRIAGRDLGVEARIGGPGPEILPGDEDLHLVQMDLPGELLGQGVTQLKGFQPQERAVLDGP